MGHRLHLRMVRRQMTCGIRGAGIAGEQEGLAAAAAEIYFLARAAATGLQHPVIAAEGAEGRRALPDLGEPMFAYIPELEPGNRFRGMTGQHAAGRRDIERTPAPAADAGFGETGVIVRRHRVDHDSAAMPIPQRLDLLD